MVTVPEQEEEAPPVGETIIRNLIAGHPEGAVRRIGLYLVLFAALSVAFWLPLVLPVAILAGVLLVSTDNLL